MHANYLELRDFVRIILPSNKKQLPLPPIFVSLQHNFYDYGLNPVIVVVVVIIADPDNPRSPLRRRILKLLQGLIQNRAF